MQRHATAVWKAKIKASKGRMTFQNKTLSKTLHTFISRFENAAHNNPEELIAAAHASSFTLKLKADLVAAGFSPEELVTKSTIILENGVITRSDLVLTANISGIREKEFQSIAEYSKETCSVSIAYNFKITLHAILK